MLVIVDCLVGFSYFLEDFGLRVQARLSGRVFVSSRLASLVGLAPSLRSVALEPVARVCALCVGALTGRSSHKAAMFPRWVPYAYQLPDLDDVHSFFLFQLHPRLTLERGPYDCGAI